MPLAPIAAQELRARVFLRSVLPLVKVVASEKPLIKRLMAGANGVVQILTPGTEFGAYISFTNGELDVTQGLHPSPDVRIAFKRLADMNTFFAGGVALPVISGALKAPLLLARALALLVNLMVLLPNALPKDKAGRAFKTRMVLFMITNALSQLNKGGMPEMAEMAKKSPDRVYQWTIEESGTAAYLRMKAGRTKSGRGTYTRRRPFVHMIFPTIDGAFAVLTASCDLVEAVRLGYVKTEGPPEYSRDIGIYMQKVEELLVFGRI